MFRSVVTEPLVHFLALSIGLFVVYSSFDPNEAIDPKTIVVGDIELLNYVQHRARRFDTNFFSAQLNSMPAEEKKRLVDDFVQEEVLFREALALGLDKNDYSYRRRLVQNMKFVYRSLIEPQDPPEQATLESYYLTHRENYRKPAEITFTHVFVKSIGAEAHKKAQSLLYTLRQQEVRFHEALAYGDRFLYHRNYVRKDSDIVASHFGSAMQADLFAIEPEEGWWHGPFESNYGWHLVMVTDKSLSHVPPMQELAAQVLQDVLREREEAQWKAMLETVTARYQIDRSGLLLGPNENLSVQSKKAAAQVVAPQVGQ